MPKPAVSAALLLGLTASAAAPFDGSFAVDDRYAVQQDSTLMSGTTLVATITPHGPTIVPLTHLTNGNGTLFFWAWDAAGGIGLWKSDGTAAGTGLVQSGIASVDRTTVGSTVFFPSSDALHGTELWKSDGTAPGTVIVKDVNPGAAGSFPFELTDVNGTLFFVVDTASVPEEGVDGRELWKSDGTPEGTVRIKVLATGPGCCSYRAGMFLTNVGGTLFFRTRLPGGGYGLWKSDGTAAGTAVVKAVDPAYAFGTWGIETMANLSGTLFLVANGGELTGMADADIWRSDGTAEGTVRVEDIRTAALYRYPYDLTAVAGRLFYTVFDAVEFIERRELWTTDGTPGAAALLGTFPAPASAAPWDMEAVGSNLFFKAPGGLWKSDGTPEGTVVVKPGSYGAGTYGLTEVNGTLFFVDPVPTGGELWRTDGTAAGTVLVRGVDLTVDDSWPQNMTDVNGVLFFTISDMADLVQVRQLWATGPAANLMANDPIPDGRRAVVLVTRPSHGRLELNEDGTFTYRPNKGFTGTDTFVYGIADDRASTATVSITVLPGPDVLFKNGFE